MANIVTKILTWAGFRVMSTWFGMYIKQKMQAAQAWVSIVNVGSQANVEEIVNWFRDNEGEQTTVTQQWYGEAEAVEHTVYRHIVYIGGITI